MPLFEMVEVINKNIFSYDLPTSRNFKKPLIFLNQFRLFQLFKILQSRYKIQNKSHIVQKNFHRFPPIGFLLHKVYIPIRTDVHTKQKKKYIYIYTKRFPAINIQQILCSYTWSHHKTNKKKTKMELILSTSSLDLRNANEKKNYCK